MPYQEQVQLLQSAFKCRIASYRLTTSSQHVLLRAFMEEIRDSFYGLINKQLEKLRCVKVNCELFGNYILQSKEIVDNKSFRTKNEVITKSTDLKQYYEELIQLLDERMSDFLEKDSGELCSSRIIIELLTIIFRLESAKHYIFGGEHQQVLPAQRIFSYSTPIAN